MLHNSTCLGVVSKLKLDKQPRIQVEKSKIVWRRLLTKIDCLFLI